MSRLMPAPSDGRRFTLYLSEDIMEDALQRRFGIQNETQYRKFLQRNPSQVDAELQMMLYRRPPMYPATFAGPSNTVNARYYA